MPRQHDNAVLSAEEKVRANKHTQQVEMAVVTAEAANIGLIFAFKLLLTAIFEEVGRVILFPFANIASLFVAILSWREYYLAKPENRKSALVKALVETIAAVGITIAIIGTFAAAAVFATLGPILFTAVLAAKSVFHLGAALYYVAKQDYAKAKERIVPIVFNALVAITVGLVMIANQTTFGIMGMIAGAIGVGGTLYKAYKMYTERPAEIHTHSEGNGGPSLDEPILSQDEGKNSAFEKTIQLNSSTSAVLNHVRRYSLDSPQFVQQISPKPVASAEDKVQAETMEQMTNIRAEIINLIEPLRPSIGANHCFVSWDTFRGNQNLDQKIPLHWWETLKIKHSECAEEIDEIIKKIEEYNSLVDANKEGLTQLSVGIAKNKATFIKEMLQDTENRKKRLEDAGVPSIAIHM